MEWWSISWIPVCIAFGCVAITIGTDITDRIVPDGIVLLVLVCSLLLRIPFGTPALAMSVLAGAVVFTLLGLLAAADHLGWHDAKLISAVTFAVPAERVIPLVLAIAIVGGVLSCIYLVLRFAVRLIMPPDGDAEAARGDGARFGRSRTLAGDRMLYALVVLGGVAYGLVR
jgi:Flp pilus assembly protein protease CpaA